MTTVRPKHGFYFTVQDVEQAKRNLDSHAWAREAYQAWKRRCDSFLELDDQLIYDCVLSMQDQTFAYGIAGCPDCGQPFPMNLEEQRPMFSDIRQFPRKSLTCPHCRMTFPNDRYPDTGQGFEKNGKGYYPVGMWNFFIAGDWFGGVRDHEGMVTKLTYLYMLTGEERYAHKALVLLDAFSAILPGTIGPRDFTPFGSDFEIGRLHMLTSIVHRIKVCIAHDYDWLYRLPELDSPSPALSRLGRRGTMRACIEKMLNDYMLTEPGGPVYDLSGGNLTNLQNHESDGVRAMLAVGLVLDNEDYLRWGVQAVEAYFYNAIGRDGMYYEGSYGYSLFTGSVFLDVALLAMRASGEEQLKQFHPFDCSRFFQFSVRNHLDVLCQGHLPCFGDWGRDTRQSTEPDRKLLVDTYRAASFFNQFSPDPDMKREAMQCMEKLYAAAVPELGGRGIDLFFAHPRSPRIDGLERPRGNTVKGQFGLAIARDANDTTLLMRVGQNNTHAHDDVLGLNFYAHGKEISADIGYGIYGTNGHFGWGTKAIAHNTVVVNRDRELKRGQLYKPFAGGEWSVIYEDGYLSAIEGQAPALYDIDAYQRMAAAVPIGDQASYIADFFYVQGAEMCDYAFHAFHEDSELAVDGVRQAAEHWTLAGVDAEEKPYFDYPDKSFGERLSTGETFTHALDGEKLQAWTPEPNNGYGYIYAVQEHAAEDRTVSARWTSSQGGVLNWHGICGPQDRILSGQCPSLEGTVQHPVLIIRSEEPAKQYAAVYQAVGMDEAGPKVAGLEPLTAHGEHVTAFRVKLDNGLEDYWAYSPQAQDQTIEVETPHGEWRIEGRCAWMRLDEEGRMIGLSLILADHAEFRETYREAEARKWLPVEQVDIHADTIWVKADQPRELPQYVKIRSGAGPSSIYPVRSMHQDAGLLKITLKDSVILSKGIVRQIEDGGIDTVYPLPLGFDLSSEGVTPFRGKAMKGYSGGEAIITGVDHLKRLRVDIVKPFQLEEKFDIVDVQIGDFIQFI
ncbi:Heparinase II/III-like protein [Chlamydia abortus]|nr:Heparinase II/III-like protein [Chlamydia abortus]